MRERARLIDILRMGMEHEDSTLIMRKYYPHVKGHIKKSFAFDELMPFLDGGKNGEIDHKIIIRERTKDYAEVEIDRDACIYIEEQIFQLLGTRDF